MAFARQAAIFAALPLVSAAPAAAGQRHQHPFKRRQMKQDIKVAKYFAL